MATTFNGFTVTADTITTPSGRVIDLTNVVDDMRGKRARMRFNHRMMYVYRAVMCVILGVKRIPSTLDVHHINLNRHDCRPCNLALMSKENHRRAHELADEIACAIVNGTDYEAPKAAYLEFVKTHAATI